nr:hypothetical protein [Tanacetum cinerariifolium]
MANHTRIYVLPSHTKKIFGNMKMVGKDFSGRDTPLFSTMMVQAQKELGEDIAIPTATLPTPIIIQPSSSQPSRKQKPRKIRRQDIELPQTSVPTETVAYEAVNEEVYDSLERATTTATSLDAEHDRGNIKESYDAGKGKRKSRYHGLKRLYKVGLSARVESFEEESLGDEDASKQRRKIADIDADEELTLVDEFTKEQGRLNAQDEIMFDVNADLQVSIAAPITTVVTIDELTLAQALTELKREKHRADKAKSNIMQEPSETPTTTTIPISSKVQDKCKGIMVEEPLKMKKKIKSVLMSKKLEDYKLRLMSKTDLQKKKLKSIRSNIVVIEQWHDVQAKIDADYELAQRLQAEEQEQLTYAEKARLFIEFLKKRKKFFATKRNKEKRNSPPTKAQQRSIMTTYLKNMDGWKPRALKNKFFAEIKELFDKAMERINSFVDFRTELVKESTKKDKAEIAQEVSSSKRAGDELDQERSKKHKIDDEDEFSELKRCLKIVPDDGDEVTIDATSLSSKYSIIVDYKIYKEGRKSLF